MYITVINRFRRKHVSRNDGFLTLYIQGRHRRTRSLLSTPSLFPSCLLSIIQKRTRISLSTPSLFPSCFLSIMFPPLLLIFLFLSLLILLLFLFLLLLLPIQYHDPPQLCLHRVIHSTVDSSTMEISRYVDE